MLKKLISKKHILILTAAVISVMLAACGMSQEQIAESLASLDSAYQTGVYDQAKKELDRLDGSYNNMTDEQKNKFGELRPLVENAVTNAAAIQDALNNAQSFYDQKMYYEAQQELEKLNNYQLPPAEKARFDALQGNVGNSIAAWKITESLRNIEALYNSGDYDLASTTINGLDISAASADQRQQYDLLRGKIEHSRLLVQAEGEYNNGKYSNALSTLSAINTSYLDAAQVQKYNGLKGNAESAKAEADKKVNSKQKAIDMVKSQRRLDGSAASDDYLGIVYSAEDRSSYYLVKATTTRNANGEARYKVYKSNGSVSYLGEASDWED